MRSPVLLAVSAALADAGAVLLFAAIGRAAHAEAGATVEVLRIGLPFLAGGALGWVLARAWRAPRRIWPQGVAVWALTWAAGMGLRGVAGGGLAPTFLLVGAVALGVLLIGWRAVTALVSRALRRPRRKAPGPAAAAR